MKKWKILYEKEIKNTNQITDILLENRGIKTEKEKEEFLNPKLSSLTPKNTGINLREFKKAKARIQKAVEKKERIIVFGDYDVDGICGTAILWETLHALGANVMPYIPHRIEEGYGLSVTSLKYLKEKFPDVKLIITVDNGIVANKAVEQAQNMGIDVIITDHHISTKDIPAAFAIVHTTKLCGAGVALLLAQEFPGFQEEEHLALCAIATVADLVPLVGPNRTILKFGLEALAKTKRIGLLALFSEAGIEKTSIDPYKIGFIIAPRLNATGRLTHAMDSLRLLCTKNQNRARLLAEKLGDINRERQRLTEESVLHAKGKIQELQKKGERKNLLFVADEIYQQGVIGLVAGKLVEEFYKPAIVVSIGEKYSKASARSVAGFNIIEFIRSASHLLVDAGGHPMAAGFTVETEKLFLLANSLEETAEKLLNEEVLTRSIQADLRLTFQMINESLYKNIQKLAPFGIGNPEPTFVSCGVLVLDVSTVGANLEHVRFLLECEEKKIPAIGFGLGKLPLPRQGEKIDIVYRLSRNSWNGNSQLELKIVDFRKSDFL